MFCKNCGVEMNDNQAVCIKCGVKVGDGNKYCPNCGNEVAENAEYCMSCGVALNSVKEEPKADQYLNGQDKLVMIIIALFLGGWGIHNFMMGEIKKGVFRIIMSCVCGIGSIFALVDLIKIAMGSYVVDPDKLV